jgi:CMP-N-acetylneuraminic acid synthetase
MATKDIADICFIIQARLGSERCRRKMLRAFGSTTLIDEALDKILRSTVIPLDQFYFAVGEEELAAKARQRGLQVFWRSPESVAAEADITQIYEWHNKLPYKWWVMINACQPFLKVETIDNFILDFLGTPPEVRGSFGVLRKKNYFWDSEHKMVTPWPEGQTLLNTKAVAESFEAAHSLYAGRMEDVGRGIHMGSFTARDDPRLFVLPCPLEVWDIDHEWEWQAALKLRAPLQAPAAATRETDNQGAEGNGTPSGGRQEGALIERMTSFILSVTWPAASKFCRSIALSHRGLS